MSDSWLHDLVSWCVTEGREDVEGWVAEAKARNRGLPLDALARKVVYQQAQLAARAPITPAAVGGIPGLRTAITARRIDAESGFVVYRMVKSILYQAAVYGHSHDRDVIDRTLLTLGLSMGHLPTRKTLVDGGHRTPERLIAAIAGSAGARAYADMLAADIGTRFTGRGRLQLLTQAGRPFFGTQNFIFISAASLAGRFVFNDLVVTPAELDELDHQIRERSRTVLGLMSWMARADGLPDAVEGSVIEALRESLVLPGISSADLSTELVGKPDWEKIRHLFSNDDERAGLLENLLMVVWADGEKTEQEDRLCRRVAAELVADRMVDDIEAAVRRSMGVSDS